jgi:hypothetical protein
MERQYVNSSMIESIGYDVSSCILEVEFKSGAVWEYPNFPEYLWNEFLVADSKGKFFHMYIRNQFPGNRIM